MRYTTELHLHTCYSFLEGASQPEEIAVRAAELGYRALALTDHDGLHGAMAFAQACAEKSIRPITGVELTLRHGLEDQTCLQPHLTLLAENERGYAHLCRLVSCAHLESPRDDVALDVEVLAGQTDGIIALTGCRQSEIARLIDAREWGLARAAAERLADLFGTRSTFLEMQQNLVHGDTYRLARLAELADTTGLGLVATGNVHYHVRERHRLQDALVAIHHRSTLESSHRQRRPNSEFYLRPPQEIEALFAAYPSAVENAVLIGERCQGFNLADRRDLGYDFPDFTRTDDEHGATADEVLKYYCRQRFEERYPASMADTALRAKAANQLEEELKLVGKHHLAGFFLIYRDLQVLATDVAQNVRGAGTVRGGSGLPPGRGRGSSVSSIICYLIGLSHVDPVKNKLFFHRFLNEDLQAVPDIDLDFARDIRAELILQVYERYGHDHAALVCSFATYRLRSAVRDLGKVLGLPATALDKLARLSESGRARSLRSELTHIPELHGQADGPLWEHLFALAEEIDSFPRHVSQHVGGMIISSRPLVELVPVQPAAMEGRFICQWDKDSCDDARFIKIDFLALGMLSLVEECLELIWQCRGEKVDVSSDVAYDDVKVYEAICAGDTIGLFQIESRAQIQMLTRTQPRTLDDLAVQVAIVRPGPIVGGAVNPYVRRREQQRQARARKQSYVPRADHPMLDDLLKDTLGVVLYQDQVLEVATTMGKLTPGQADQFRRAMSRRRSLEAMERFREQFLRGARSQGVSERDASAIFDKLCAFSEFGFPKSHAYAFAVLAYQSAWLRHYYPEEFYAALLNNQPMGFYAPHVLVGDAKRHGMQVLRVSVNRSLAHCFPLPASHGLLLGLTQVKGLGEDLAQAIVDEREAHGAYRSLRDLLRRSGMGRSIAEKLIAVGTLSDLGLGRRELLWQLGLLLPETTGRGERARRKKSWQLTLGLPVEQDMVELPDMTTWERMVADYGLLGLSPSYHPLGLLRSRLPTDVTPAEQLSHVRDGAVARAAGLVVCRQRPGTARGFVFLLLEDETGIVNVVIQPDLYEAQRSIIRGTPYLWVEGRVQQQSGSLNLLATHVAPLDRVLHKTNVGAVPSEAPDALPASDAADRQTTSTAHLSVLQEATPSSHDFH